MTIQTHHINQQKTAEIIADGIVIDSIESGVDLLGDLYYQGYDGVIIHQHNLTPAFFDLKTGIAGEILQKFSTYRVRLIIVGDFSRYESKSLRNFIGESNRSGHVRFVGSTQEAIGV